LLVAVAARPGEILSYDAEDHKHEQNGEAGTAVSGSYSYKDVDGKEYTVEYVADENGYRATGAHLPVAPEVPAAPEAAEPAAEPAAEAAAEPEAKAPAITYVAVASPFYAPFYSPLTRFAYSVHSPFVYTYIG